MKYISKVFDKEIKLELSDTGTDSFDVHLSNHTVPLQIFKTDSHDKISALIGNRSYELEINKNESGYVIQYKGNRYKISVEDERLQQFKKFSNHATNDVEEKDLKAPMPGLIVATEVEPGQKVKTGQGLVIIEAMKMENEIKATRDVTIKDIIIKEGQPVDKNQILMTFK